MPEIHTRPAKPTSLVLYGITPAGQQLPKAIVGLGGAEVHTVDAAGLSAVYSAAPASRLRPERKHLSAHQALVQALASSGTILPVAFGMLFPSAERLGALLEEHAETFLEQVQHIADRVEMTVRLALTDEDVFQHFVHQSPELRRLRDQIASGAAGHDQKMAAGRLFESLLNARREEASALVSDELDPVSADILSAPLRAERELVHMSCLVERTRLAEFEAAVDRAAARFDDKHTFGLSGPWPAQSFVSIRLTSEGSTSLQEAA